MENIEDHREPRKTVTALALWVNMRAIKTIITENKAVHPARVTWRMLEDAFLKPQR